MKRSLLLLLWALPATAGVFDQFEDLGQLREHLLSGGPPKDGIPAVTNPSFTPASRVNWVAPTDLIIIVERDGEVKAYPENLGWWHEIVNDRLGDGYVSVTLCPLTGTPQVFDATAPDGGQIEFGVSGLLLNSNLVMYDRRDNQTLYPQMIYTGINGRFKDERLEMLPAIVTTFATAQRLFPDVPVAQFGTGLERYPARQRENYTDPRRFFTYPYNDYRTNDGYFIAPITVGSPDLAFYAPKEVVTGLCIGSSLRAYPFADMAPQAVINDTLGGEAVLVVFEQTSRTSIPYSRAVDGQPLTFYRVEAANDEIVAFRDVETGSRWDILGRAVDGPLSGRRLEQLPAHNAMWFAWSAWWPESSVWEGGDGIIEAPPVTAVLEPLSEAVPAAFHLGVNVPNPFNPATRIPFELPDATRITLRIYNAAGQQVRTLASGWHAAGAYETTWDGRDAAGRAVASGTYLVELHAPESGLRRARSLLLAR
jgi:hypothetical protein